MSRLERHDSGLPSAPPALPRPAATGDIARYRVPTDRTPSSAAWSPPPLSEAPPSRTRLGVRLAVAAIAVFVAGTALRATLTARVSSPSGQADGVPGAAGTSVLGPGGAPARSPWALPKDASGPLAIARDLDRLPVPDVRATRPSDLRRRPETSRPGPGDAGLEPDPVDPWNAGVARPWWVPLPPAPFSAATPSPGPGISMPSPAATPSSGDGRQPATSVRLFIEYNATDGDAGVQVSFDGPAWTRVAVVGPTGRTVVETADPSGVSGLDLTESVPEDQEPTLVQLFQMFPPGDYAFKGTTVGGATLEATGTLSYDLPDPVVIVGIDPAVPAITWRWVPGLRSPIRELAGFQVILENAREIAVSFDLDPLTTSLAVPSDFLEPGTAYRVDVLAIASNGNRTVTETAFITPRPRR